MFKFFKLFTIVFCLGFLVLLATPVNAQTTLLPDPSLCTDPNDPTQMKTLECCIKTGNCTLDHGVALFARAGQFMLGIIGSLVLAVFIYGGFLWLTSGGVPDRVSKGRKAMMGALIGLIIVFGAYVLVINVVNMLEEGAEGLEEDQCTQFYADSHECIDIINDYTGNTDACLIGLCPGGTEVQCCPKAEPTED